MPSGTARGRVLSLALLVLACGLPAFGCSGQADAPQSASTSNSPRQENTADEMAESVHAVIEQWLGSTTGVVALLRAGDDTETVTSELANVATGEEMTPQTRVHVASITKPMVATAVMQLVEEEVIALDDSVEKWLPGLLRRGDETTVEQLLSHRSGLATYEESLDFDPSGHYRPADLVALVAQKDLEFEPGTSYRYSNTNYVVLGLLLEAVTGDPAVAVLQERIFAPTGMTATSLLSSKVPGHPVAHGYEGSDDVTTANLGIAFTAGGVVSTVDDLDRFWRALLSGDLVSPASLDLMTRDYTDEVDVAYGLGVDSLELACGTAIGHGGSIPGFTSAAYTLHDSDRAVMVAINDSDAFQQLGEILEAALCDP